MKKCEDFVKFWQLSQNIWTLTCSLDQRPNPEPSNPVSWKHKVAILGFVVYLYPQTNVLGRSKQNSGFGVWSDEQVLGYIYSKIIKRFLLICETISKNVNEISAVIWQEIVCML